MKGQLKFNYTDGYLNIVVVSQNTDNLGDNLLKIKSARALWDKIGTKFPELDKKCQEKIGNHVEITGVNQDKNEKTLFWMTEKMEIKFIHQSKAQEKFQQKTIQKLVMTELKNNEETKNSDSVSKIFDEAAPSYQNIFSVVLSDNVDVFSMSGNSRVFFKPAETAKKIGTVLENDEYFKMFVLGNLKKAGLLNSKITHNQQQFVVRIRVKSQKTLSGFKFTLRQIMTPVIAFGINEIRGIIGNVQFLYNGTPFTGKLSEKRANEQTFLNKATQEQITIYDYFKSKGITIASDCQLLQVETKKCNLYMPISQCQKNAGLEKGLKDQTQRFRYLAKHLNQLLANCDKRIQLVPYELENLKVFPVDVVYQKQIDFKMIIIAPIGMKSRQVWPGESIVAYYKLPVQIEEFKSIFQEQKERQAGEQQVKRFFFVVLESKNPEIYWSIKKVAHEAVVQVQCLQKSTLDNQIYLNATIKQANSKFTPQKYLPSQVISIGVDVHHNSADPYESRMGFHARVHGQNPFQYSFSTVIGKQLEILPAIAIQNAFSQFQKTLSKIDIKQYVVVYTRDFCGVQNFISEEIPAIKETKLFKNAKDFHLFLADKRHDVCAYERQVQTKISQNAAFLQDDVFIMSTKLGAWPILYQYFHPNCEVHLEKKRVPFDKRQMIQAIKSEASLHFYLKETKLGIAHKNSDEIAYAAHKMGCQEYEAMTSYS